MGISLQIRTGARPGQGKVVFSSNPATNFTHGANNSPVAMSASAPETKLCIEQLKDRFCLPIAQHLIKKGFVDPDRNALFGHSIGGRRAFLALTQHSGLFAAGMFNDPVVPDRLYYSSA